MKPVLWIAAALVTLGVGGFFLKNQAAPSAEVKDYVLAKPHRRPAPDFALPDYRTGDAIKLSQHRGKVVLVNFWATWCPPCRQEIPDFIKVQDALRPNGFEIIGLALDEGGARDVTPFAREIGINYLVAIGNQEVASEYGGIRGIPTSFLIDRQGNIARTFPGMIDGVTLEQAVRALL